MPALFYEYTHRARDIPRGQEPLDSPFAPRHLVADSQSEAEAPYALHRRPRADMQHMLLYCPQAGASHGGGHDYYPAADIHASVRRFGAQSKYQDAQPHLEQ